MEKRWSYLAFSARLLNWLFVTANSKAHFWILFKRIFHFSSFYEQTPGLAGTVCVFWWPFFHFRNSETSLVCPKKDNHLTHEMLMSKMSGAVFTVRRRLVREPIPVTSRVRWRAPAFRLRHVCFIALTFVYSPSNYFWLLVDKDKWGD